MVASFITESGKQFANCWGKTVSIALPRARWKTITATICAKFSLKRALALRLRLELCIGQYLSNAVADITYYFLALIWMAGAIEKDAEVYVAR